MNWGDNLTLIVAIRPTGFVTLGTCWRAVITVSFVHWVRTRLAPRLRRGDIVPLDNLKPSRSGSSSSSAGPRGGSCRPIRMTVILSSRGARSSGAFEPTPLARPERCGRWLAPPATWSVRITVANGLRMLGTAIQVPIGINDCEREGKTN